MNRKEKQVAYEFNADALHAAMIERFGKSIKPTTVYNWLSGVHVTNWKTKDVHKDQRIKDFVSGFGAGHIALADKLCKP